MSLRSPLGAVLGHGSAKQGVAHWWVQRVTAIAMVPLTLWFVFQLVHLQTADFDAVRQWAAAGLNPVLLMLLIVAMTWHSALGVQVVLEDYVPHKGTKVAAVLVNNLLHIALAVTAVYAVLRIAFTTFTHG